MGDSSEGAGDGPAEFPIHRWTLLLSEDREEITLQLQDSATIEIPITISDAEELVRGLVDMIRTARGERDRRGPTSEPGVGDSPQA
jgi:hypothetical protein